MVSAHPPAVTVREMPPRHVVPFIFGPAAQRVGPYRILPSTHICGRNIANDSRDRRVPALLAVPQELTPTSERAIETAPTSESVTGTPASCSRSGWVKPPL